MIVLTDAAKNLGNSAVSTMSYQQWLIGQVLAGLAAVPNLRMTDCYQIAIDTAGNVLNALTAPAPAPSPAGVVAPVK